MTRIRLLLARAALVAGFATALFPAQEGKREPDSALLAAQRAVADVTAQISSPLDSLAEARSLVEGNRFTEAESLVRRYLDTHRTSADGHYLLGYVLFKQRKAKESLAEYTEAAQYRKPTAAELEAVAGDYVLLHDYPDADKWFSLAVEWDPASFQARYLLARAKYAENRFDEAVAAFLECLKLDPRSVKAEDNLGLSYEGLDKTDEALAAYHQAILWEGSEGKDANPYIDLGALLVNANQASEAIEPLLKAVELAPGEMRAHRELGKAYAHLGHLEKAQREFEKTVELAPDVASPHYLLAQVYRKRGLTQKAQAESDRYRELTSTHSSDNETGMAGRTKEDRKEP
jgi:tetratricopeptide (TPR) repeat protein